MELQVLADWELDWNIIIIKLTSNPLTPLIVRAGQHQQTFIQHYYIVERKR